MSTYQHEQYYIHADTKGASKETLEKVRVLLIENDWDDHEFSDGELVVDGFDNETEALACDEIIHEYLEYDSIF